MYQETAIRTLAERLAEEGNVEGTEV